MVAEALVRAEGVEHLSQPGEILGVAALGGDATSVKVREQGRIVSVAVIIAVGVIDDANARLLQRNVQRCKMLHGCSPRAIPEAGHPGLHSLSL
jgi:hypothetical protein